MRSSTLIFVASTLAQAAFSLAINPDYELPKLPALAPAPALTNPRSALSRRATVKFCNNFGRANVNRIREGTEYLRRLGGAPSLGPSLAKCSRVSCSYNAAIYWCNHNKVTKTVSWVDIAQSSYHITEVCPQYPSGFGWNVVSELEFKTSNWNTIVREDDC
ncbi:hypothetical protein B0H63DRAFT_533794 [Podospora didyma]|uniref:Avirulence Effector AvrLm4-7 domain-containing protein n=1 Tax=Podospora didyma TaxID=330526 RepID=A0AAE0P8B5_9PEZI|nr:hypothetical protein B0H63DRAFT_533794 [Podospora didyma]